MYLTKGEVIQQEDPVPKSLCPGLVFDAGSIMCSARDATKIIRYLACPVRSSFRLEHFVFLCWNTYKKKKKSVHWSQNRTSQNF